MAKKTIFIVILIVFIVSLIGASKFINNYSENNLLNHSNKNSSLSDEITGNNTSILEDKSGEQNIIEEDVKMVKLTSENFEEEALKSEKTVLVDFYADWCGPCQMMSSIIEKIAEENKDIVVGKINVDEEEDLAVRYNVMSIPTFIVIKNGEEVNRIVGAVSKSKIEGIIK